MCGLKAELVMARERGDPPCSWRHALHSNQNDASSHIGSIGEEPNYALACSHVPHAHQLLSAAHTRPSSCIPAKLAKIMSSNVLLLGHSLYLFHIMKSPTWSFPTICNCLHWLCSPRATFEAPPISPGKPVVTGGHWPPAAEDGGTSIFRTTSLGAGRKAAWVVGQNLVHVSSMKLRSVMWNFVSFLFRFFRVWHTSSPPSVQHAAFRGCIKESSQKLISHLLRMLACFGGLNWPEISRNARSQLVMYLEVIIWGGGPIVLQCLAHVQHHFRPLLTKLVFKHSDVTHVYVRMCIYQIQIWYITQDII